MALDEQRLISDEFLPEKMDQRLGKELESVTLIAVVEDEEKVGPNVINVGRHEQTTFKNQVFAPDYPVRRHEHQDSVLSAWVRSQRLRHIKRLAEVGTPLDHRFGENSLVGFPW